MNIPGLIEEIYHAPATPDRWQIVLEEIKRISDAEGALLFTYAPEGIRWISTASISTLVKEWVGSESAKQSERGQLIRPTSTPPFLSDRFTHETQFLKPRGLGWSARTSISLPTGREMIFSIDKALEKGPVGPEAFQVLDSLRPHLVRSVALAVSTARSRVLTTLEILQRVGVAVAALRRDGSFVEANALFVECGQVLTVDQTGQLQFSSKTAQRTFREALSEFGATDHPEPRSIVAASTDPGGALLAHLVPFEQFRDDIFQDAAILLLVPTIRELRAPSESILMLLFDLTPTEARVVRLLAGGASVKTIARMQRVTPNTVRMQLKSVFAKTGVHRQAQLVSLVSRLSVSWRAPESSSAGD